MNGPLVTRRRVVQGVAGAALLGTVDAFAIEPTWLDVNHHELSVPKLPRALEGYRIAQITDAHLQGLGSVERALVEEIVRSNVQLVLLTGDIVNTEYDYRLLQDFCRELRAPGRTVLATLGNWEYWGNLHTEDLARAYATVGVTLLGNDAHCPESGLCVVTTDDSLTRRARLETALSKRRQAPVSVFATHCPELFDRVPAGVERFDLSLAGHTHGGQVRVGSLTPFLPPGSGRFVSGWYDLPFGRAYVSRGTGMSVAPARFGCRPELPVFTLRRA
ncbi:MAG TPA: metallophosphoesterase [Polyangiaceae bacterium]